MNDFAKFGIIVGLIFSILAALVAAGTTYQELYEHRDDDYKKREAIHSGVFAFIFFVLLTLVLAFVLPKVVR